MTLNTNDGWSRRTARLAGEVGEALVQWSELFGG